MIAFIIPTILANKPNIKHKIVYIGLKLVSVLFEGNLLTPSPSKIFFIPTNALLSSAFTF